jgi:beta-lactamase class A
MWGLDLRDADTGEALASVHPEHVMDTASIGKLLLLADVADGICSGRYIAGELVSRASLTPVGDSGLWQHLADIDSLTVRDAALLIGAVSDNLATNALLAHTGLEAPNHMAQRLGLTSTRLHDIVRDVRTAHDPRTLSSSSAGDLVELAQHIHGTRTALTSDASTMMRQWLRVGTDLSMVAAGLNLDPLAHNEVDRGVLLWNKTGTDSRVRADVGVAAGPTRTVTYAVIANWHGEDMRDDALDAMQEIGRAIRNNVTR